MNTFIRRLSILSHWNVKHGDAMGAEKKRGGRRAEGMGGETRKRGEGDGKLDDNNKKRKEAWRRSCAFSEKYYFT